MKRSLSKVLSRCLNHLCQLAGHLVLSLGIYIASVNGALTDEVEEYTLKAALILNFARFTEWPDDHSDRLPDTFQLCVKGNSTVQEAFANLQGKKVGARQISIKKINRHWNVQGCQLLFISGTNRRRLLRVFSAIDELPVMTVGEMTGFAKSGGIINLVMEENKIRFHINLKAARRTGLKISSRLLNLATIIDG